MIMSLDILCHRVRAKNDPLGITNGRRESRIAPMDASKDGGIGVPPHINTKPS